MLRSTKSLVLATVLTLSPVTNLLAASPFFWDEFDRGDLMDTDVPWSTFRSGEVLLADDTATFTPLADDFPGFGITEQLTDLRIRTQLRFHDVEGVYAINPWIGLYLRNQANFISYWAGPASNGNVYVGESDSSTNDIRGQKSLFSSREIDQEDIVLEFTAVGDTMTLFAWLADDERPLEPALTLRDPTLDTAGTLGFVMNPSPQLTGFDVRYFAVLPGTPGDFNASRVLDVEDIDLLAAEIRNGGANRAFDLNEDAQVDRTDYELLITSRSHFGTWLGDSNLDGAFNTDDLIGVFQAGQYEDEITGNSTWATGDWDGDGEFESGDLVVAFAAGGFEQGPRGAVVTVPEPNANLLLIVLLTICQGWYRRHRNRRHPV